MKSAKSAVVWLRRHGVGRALEAEIPAENDEAPSGDQIYYEKNLADHGPNEPDDVLHHRDHGLRNRDTFLRLPQNDFIQS